MRGNGPARPLEVALAVRALLGIKPRPDVEPSPAEALPIDPMADLEATRRILANLRRLGPKRETQSNGPSFLDAHRPGSDRESGEGSPGDG